jgi:class 3 adenylate cyclase
MRCSQHILRRLCVMVRRCADSSNWLFYTQFVAGAPIAATEQRLVALMATDIAGFTSLSAEIGAEEVVQMLDS